MTMISNLVKEKNKIQLMEGATKAAEIEIPLGKSMMERDPEEDKRILKILKDIDEENAKLKAPQKKATKKESKKSRTPKKSQTTATVPSEKKSATPKANAPAAATASVPEPEPIMEPAAATEPEPVTEPEPEPAPAPKKSSSPSKTKKNRSSKKAATKKEVNDTINAESEPIAVEKDELVPMEEAMKVIEAVEESFNEAMEESSRESAVIEELKNMIAKSDEGTDQRVDKADSTAEDSPTKKKGLKTRRTKKGSESPPSDEISNPWGSLKESTLKRKTVAELTEYLTEREIDVEGLTKTELVGTIQNL
jgi:translation initiation factor IF-2